MAQHSKKPKKGPAVALAPLLLKVKTDHASYAASDDILFTLSVKNTTTAPLVLHFNSGQRYDFELRKDKGTKIWQWARGRMFTMMLSSSTLQPGASLTFTDKYHPGSADTPALAPGFYTLVASLTTDAKPTPSATMTFKVK